MVGNLAYVTTNRAMPAFDAEAQRQRVDARERQDREVDAALRSGLGSVVAGQARNPPATAQAAPVPAQAGAGAIHTAATTVADPTDDDDAAVRTILGEAANQGEQGMAGVAHVVRNRARQSGMSPRDVVLAPGQFEPWQTRRGELMAIDRNSPQYQEALRIWRASGDGTIADPTGGADHFYSPRGQAAAGRQPPAWAAGQTPTVIGGHNFYGIGYRGTPGAGAATGLRAVQASAPQQAPQQPTYQPTPNPLAPAITELLRVPGGGRTALAMIQTGENLAARREGNQLRFQAAQTRAANGRNGQAALDLRERQGYERNMMIALGRGQVDLARTFAERAGISLPEQVWQDQANHARFAAGAMLARRYYADRGQAAQFVQEYMRDGNAERAATAVGMPRGGDPNWRPLWVKEGEQQVLQLLNPRTGEVRGPTGADGEPTRVERPGTAGGGRGAANNAERRQTLMRIYNNDSALVDRLMSGVAPNPRQINSALQGFMRLYGNDPSLIGRPAEVQRRAEADMDRTFPDWRRIRDGAAVPPTPAPTPAPTPTPAPSPAALPPAPTESPAPPSGPPGEVRLRDGTVGTLTGERTQDGRPIYRTPDGRRFAPNASASSAPRA